ncbi:MAG TPA: type VI secretion system-associated FHA domain protein TagH, partial [Rhodopila sp.]|nr:type VI secretion system-associated FHA domain protein TagH [Rhodopila sp.]
DALLALLGAGRRSEMGAAEAVAEALRDIRMHELATIAAMQAAVRGVLRELDPATLRDGAPGGGLLASQRKVRAWDAFEAAHARITQAMSDNFDSAFGRAFARAYGQALREIRPEAR